MFFNSAPNQEDQELIKDIDGGLYPEIEGVYMRIVQTDYYKSNLIHMANSAETNMVRGQLANMLENTSVINLFKSFICKFDEDNVLTECWGITSIILWPDSIAFKLF